MQAAEPAAEPPQQPRKPGSARARKTTPRARPKKAADGKKAATPRRRASPRNRKPPPDAEPKKKEKHRQKEEKDKNKEEDNEQIAPPPPPSSSLATVNEEEEGEGEDMKQETKAEKAEAETQEAAAAAAGEELPPAQDTQLRRTYLQRMYRQLQSTHPNQDDAMIRQIATNVEMEACQKAATRHQYVAAMDHEIHKLMQFELEQANAPVYTNDPAQSYQSEQGQQPAVSSGMDSGYSQNQISQSHSYEYAQALAKAQEQEQVNCSGRSSSFSTPRQSMSGDVSFQSLMENQNQGYGRDGMQSHQQQNTPSRVMSMQNLQQMGNQFYPTSSMTPPTSQNFAIHSNVSEMASQSIPRNMMEVQQQQGNFHMQHQQQQMQHSGSMRPQSRVTTFQEFTAQIQHLDKSVLIELLWNQRSALARWQNQAKQLELRLAAQQQTAASNMGSPAGFQSPYNSPMIGGGTFASPNIAAEAEMERSRDRSNSRMAQLPHQQQQQMPQYPYSQQQSTPSNATYSQADGTWENPQLYWQRIRNLKTSYEDQLRTAQRALAHNTAPPNSIYSMKAQSMMQNISMVLNILNEPPTNVQPRKFEVLNSIERFMHVSVIPIVQKVLSSGSTPQVSQAAVTSRSSPAMRASVATYSPSVPSTQGNAVGMSSTLTQSSDNQYTGARWTSFGELDTPRQHSRGIFGDAESGEANGPPRMMDGLTAVENSPNNAGCESTVYAPVRAENDTQSDTSMGQQNMLYEAPTVTLKESSSLSLPALESRPSTITDTRLSSDASLSPGGSARDSSSKVMDSTSVDDDFSDFPVLEFEDPVADGNSFVKENNPSNVSRKRGIEDV